MKYSIHYRSIALLLGYVATSGCGADVSSPTASSAITGLYNVSWSRSASQCAPQPLPPPASGDTSQYVALPNEGRSQEMADVQLSAVTMSLTPRTTAGTAIAARTLTGTLTPLDSVVLARSSNRTEGPRADGHAYFVNEVAVDSVYVSLSVETPPGGLVESVLFGRGSETFTFRSGGPSGNVYTTCVVTESLEGAKTRE